MSEAPESRFTWNTGVWLGLPQLQWSVVDGLLLGVGPGIGTADISYALLTSEPRLVNGLLDTSFAFPSIRAASGGGVILRADEDWNGLAVTLLATQTRPFRWHLVVASIREGEGSIVDASPEGIAVSAGEQIRLRVTFRSWRIAAAASSADGTVSIITHTPLFALPGRVGLFRMQRSVLAFSSLLVSTQCGPPTHHEPTADGMLPKKPSTILISFVPEDSRWHDLVRKHIEPIASHFGLSIRTRFSGVPGKIIVDDLDEIIEDLRVAICLVSPDYITCENVMKVEVPRLLEVVEEESRTLAWLPVRPSAVAFTPLGHVNPVVDAGVALSSMKPEELDICLSKMAEFLSATLARTVHEQSRPM